MEVEGCLSSAVGGWRESGMAEMAAEVKKVEVEVVVVMVIVDVVSSSDSCGKY